MIKAVLLFILGLILLVKGGDWFVQGALIRGKITRFQGVLLLLVNFVFCIAQFVL